MVEHVVLFKVKDGASSDAIVAMMKGLSSLKSKVPGVLDLTVGPNFSDRNQGYTHGLVVRFRDRAALDAYLPHPAHQEVVQKFVRPILGDVIAVDYEIR
jgi:hypothetical protein